jgi:hypothetical protein
MSKAREITPTSFQRILLHAACIIRQPGKLSWHWSGIMREIALLCSRISRLKEQVNAAVHFGRNSREKISV